MSDRVSPLAFRVPSLSDLLRSAIGQSRVVVQFTVFAHHCRGGVWPAIYLAAFAVNALVGDSILVAVGIAMGNTLGPVVARFSLDRLRGFHPTFVRAARISKNRGKL